jgi:RND superfamily putative drug exporter
MERVARAIVRQRWWVIAIWLAGCAALAPLAGRLESELDVAARVSGSEATAVETEMAARFGSPFARWAVLVIAGVPSPDSAAGLGILRAIVDSISVLPDVRGTLSYLDVADTLFAGAGGRGAIVVVGLDPAAPRPDAMVPAIRAATARIGDRLRGAYPEITLRWTGEVPLNFDLRRTSAAESNRAELRVLPLTLALLLVAFGTIVAAILPVLAAAIAITISLGAAVVINAAWPLSILLQNIVSMIGLGVGIDYALLTVTRFREALAAGCSPDDAAVAASCHAGGTIALSGAAVMIGFAALLLFPLNELQAVGTGGLIVVGVSVLMAVTLLPAILASLGHRIDDGRILRRRRGTGTGDGWRRWGRWVVAHPWLVLLVAGTPLIALAWEARRLRSELPRGNWLPRSMETAQAVADLAGMRRYGIVNSARVLLDFPPGVTVYDTTGWSTLRRVTAAIARDPRVGRVQSLATVVPTEHPSELLFSFVPAQVRGALVTGDGRAAIVEVVPHQTVEFNDLTTLARDIRRLEISGVGGDGTRLRVGGMAAFNADYIDVIDDRATGAVALVLLATLLALMVGFRSVLIPVKALALNLLSVAGAFGAVVLVFQDGHGGRLLGIDGPLYGVFPAVPILVFCIVFGLSMDYEVFLVARVAEARRLLGESDAIVEGLARTGSVITSAAAIMFAVFAAFTLGEFVLIKILGFALAVAVLLDATVVRMAIGPALLALAGKWNWWPGRGVRPRLVSKIGQPTEHEAVMAGQNP